MEDSSVAAWERGRPRFVLAVLTMAAVAYALDKSFFLGLTASKWIGLADHATLMSETQDQSRNWGIAALILEVLALTLFLPSKSRRDKLQQGDATLLTAGFESRFSGLYITQCAVRAVVCILGTIAFAVLHPLVANLFSR